MILDKIKKHIFNIDMKRVLLLTVIIFASCQPQQQEANEPQKQSPKTLDEVEFFYKERSEARIFHIDPECGDNCVYAKKEEVDKHQLCGRRISKELAREIMTMQ